MTTEQPARDMRVTILGSGTCVPSRRRSSCSVLVEAAGTKLLLDAGPGTMRRLLDAGTEIFDISMIFLSHFHPDHSGELVPFLFSSKYPDQSRRSTPLTLVAGAGFADFFNRLKAVYGHWIELESGLLRIEEMSSQIRDRRRFGPITVESIPVEHSPESVAFRITGAGGESVVYSGDTDISENLVSLARGADLFICESAFPDARKVRGHLTPSRAGEMAERAGVGQLVLTHFYPECEKADIEKECRTTYTGMLALAEDLMTLIPGSRQVAGQSTSV